MYPLGDHDQSLFFFSLLLFFFFFLSLFPPDSIGEAHLSSQRRAVCGDAAIRVAQQTSPTQATGDGLVDG